ncbi:MAG: hypothetical protein V3T26_05925 [candidate division NC10 bacterium]
MERSQWKFRFAAALVAEAAQNRADHHRDRRKWWEDELEKTDKQLRETGVEFRSHEVTGGQRLDLAVDPTLKNRYEEGRFKVQAHTEKWEEFERWTFALETAAEDVVVLELDIDDIAFFGIERDEPKG